MVQVMAVPRLTYLICAESLFVAMMTVAALIAIEH